MARKTFKKVGEAKLHKSFRRSYREDYLRETNIPGMGQQMLETFEIIFRGWKVFLPLIGLAVGLAVVLMRDSSEVMITFGVLIFLMVWLTTLFLLRHKMAGQAVGLREALYNAMAPLISTLIVFIVAVIQAVPLFVLIIAYSAAVQTNFLAEPFYAVLFAGFAGLMVTISGYLLSSTLMALIAVSAPGMYPLKALGMVADLMAGRRMKLLVRIVAMLLELAVVWGIVMVPLVGIDLFLKQFEWASAIPFIPFVILVMSCFSAVYMTTYLYIYYRYLIDL